MRCSHVAPGDDLQIICTVYVLLLSVLSTEVNMVISHEVDTCLTSPASRNTWLTCRQRLLTVVLGNVFQAISIMPEKEHELMNTSQRNDFL